MRHFLLFLFLAVSAMGDADRWWSHVAYLADDALEGRNTGSVGHRKAAAYVAQHFEQAGLKPAGTQAYFQPIKYNVRRILEEQCSLALVRDGKSESLALGEEANLSVRGTSVESIEAPLYFAGYGLTVPELKYDDLAGANLRGKVVVYITGGPSSIPGPLLAHFQSGAERGKFLKAAGVLGTMTIANPRITDVPWARSTLARLQPSMSLTEALLDEDNGQRFSASINAAHAGQVLAGSGHTIEELLAIADSGKPLPRFPIPASVKARVKFESSQVESQNVAGILPGTDPRLKNEYVVISAHLDHVGTGQPIKGDGIYNGAMDNASGVASLIDMAESFHESKKPLRRSLLFLAVTGEEKGLTGSRYFATHPTVPAASIVADLNMDMFLPLYPFKIVMVLGLDESRLGDDVKEIAKPLGIQVQADPEPLRNRFIRSDQYSFIRRGIPSLAFKVGYEKDSPEAAIAKKWTAERYHAPSDDLQQPVDKQAAADFNRFLALLAETVANRTERPRWNANSFFRRFAQP